MVLAAEMWANQSAMKFVLGVLNHVDSQTSECPDTRREVARNMATRFHAGCKLDPAGKRICFGTTISTLGQRLIGKIAAHAILS
jgi:hypothetical protein